MLHIIRTDSDHPEFRALVALLDQDLAIRNGDQHSFYSQFNKLDKIKHALVAFEENRPVGCGAMRAFAPDAMEMKRMFVLPEYRGQGFAATILAALETWAAELGFVRCVLETGQKQPEAIRLYERSGYSVIPNFGPYEQVENSVCMEKRLN